MTWTPERETELRQLTADGWSAGKIAEKFGMTRNAIIGKQHRTGIASGGAVNCIQQLYPSTHWTAEEEDRLRAMTAAGELLSKIANELGKTPGAISAKQSRMGISRRAPRNNGAIIHALKAARKRLNRIKVLELEIRPVCDIVPKKIPYMELRPHHCRYPLDERGDDGLILSCGHQVMKGHSYCISHCYAVFNEFIAEPILEGSTAVVQAAVNRLVAGSIPAPPAIEAAE